MDQATNNLARWRNNIYLISQLIQNDVSSTKVRSFSNNLVSDLPFYSGSIVPETRSLSAIPLAERCCRLHRATRPLPRRRRFSISQSQPFRQRERQGACYHLDPEQPTSTVPGGYLTTPSIPLHLQLHRESWPRYSM